MHEDTARALTTTEATFQRMKRRLEIMETALRTIADLPMPEQDNMLSGSMRACAQIALQEAVTNPEVA